MSSPPVVNPSLPPIPVPVDDINSILAVLLAMRLRINNLTTVVKMLQAK